MRVLFCCFVVCFVEVVFFSSFSFVYFLMSPVCLCCWCVCISLVLKWCQTKRKCEGCGGVTELVSHWTWVVLMCFARVQSGGDEETGVLFRGVLELSQITKIYSVYFCVARRGENSKKK